MSKSLDEETLKAAGIEFFVEVSDPKTIFKECSRAEQLVTYLLRFRNLMTAKTFVSLKTYIGNVELENLIVVVTSGRVETDKPRTESAE